MSAPTVGRIVHYTLTAQDAEAINRRREDHKAYAARHRQPIGPGHDGATGHQAHVGNSASEGDQYAAVVVRVFNPTTTTANLKVLLDGNDDYWATSATEGEGPGRWAWPARA